MAKSQVPKAMRPKKGNQGGEVAKKRKRLGKGSLRAALLTNLKATSGRKDLIFEDAPKVATNTMFLVPPHQRAGYPITFPKGAADPTKWRTINGKDVMVDFSRAAWLPDDWGQGVKATNVISRSGSGNGGTYTVFMAPDGATFYHKPAAEEYAGRKFTIDGGINGQIRLAKLQAAQAVQLARAQIKECKSGEQQFIGVDSDESFFKVLSLQERKHLAPRPAFHFGIVSARRATKLQGIQDIFMVQTQFVEAGVTPTWYVDEASLKDYRALGLKAVVGGKLTAARNKVLDDANRLGKVAVECSDDISAWEYRHGKNATERRDDLMNAAWTNAKRFVVSPVAAARFILAKMRSSPLEKKPQLGGLYMLGSCSRTFCSDAFADKHFIIGDFFVVDRQSKVRFDKAMTLKEDYDFTCAHMKEHGSVLRCNRMTLNVKHYSNSGGACSNRDGKGAEEKKNIAILNQKWPNCFRANPKRKNEVIMKWRDAGNADDEEEDGGKSGKAKATVKKNIIKKSIKVSPGSLPALAGALLSRQSKESKQPYIAARCRKASGRRVDACVGKLKYRDVSGNQRVYSVSDLRYDLTAGYLIARGKSGRSTTWEATPSRTVSPCRLRRRTP